MSWIESHQSLRDHPKTLRLAAAWKVSVPEAIGLLHLLWWWAVDYAPDGNLSFVNRRELVKVLMGRVSERIVIEGLVRARFVQRVKEDGKPERLELHDWQDYAGRLIAQREANKERAKQWRATHNVRVTYEQRTGLPTGPTRPTEPKTPPTPPRKDGGTAPPDPPSVAIATSRRRTPRGLSKVTESDLPTKPNGHPVDCACEDCFTLLTESAPK